MAFGAGSAVANQAVGAIFNSMSGSKESAPQTPAVAAPKAAGPCDSARTSFNQCLNSSNASNCDSYFTALQNCQSNNAWSTGPIAAFSIQSVSSTLRCTMRGQSAAQSSLCLLRNFFRKNASAFKTPDNRLPWIFEIFFEIMLIYNFVLWMKKIQQLLKIDLHEIRCTKKESLNQYF